MDIKFFFFIFLIFLYADHLCPSQYTNLYAQYRFRKALGLLHRTFLQIVEEHRAEMDQEKSNLDLVDLMVRAQDEETGFTFTDKDILSQCHTLYAN